MINPISVIMPYYDNPTMLLKQLEEFSKMSSEVQELLELMIVDDGSPEHPAGELCAQQLHTFLLQIYRIDVNVRWNQDAARNIGARHAGKKWLLLTDIDHLIPEGTLRYLMNAHLSEKAIYKFARLEYDGVTPYKVHPNTWFMTDKMYERVGGYDERFAGYYGTDWDFRDRTVRAAEKIQQLPCPIIRVGREHIPDASTPREFGRKSPDDAAAIKKIRDARGKAGPERFRFPYHKVL